MNSFSSLVARTTVVVLVALGACEPVDTEGVLLSCTRDDECPAGQVCDTDSLCSAPTVVVDNVVVTRSEVRPTIIGRPFVDDDAPLEVRFVLSGIVETAVVRLSDGVDVFAEEAATRDTDADDVNAWIARFTVEGDEVEGAARVLVDVVDQRGRASTFALPQTVTFDFTGPLPVAAALQRLPNPARSVVALEILDETDIGPAIDVRLVFSTSEPVFIDGAEADVDVAAGVVDNQDVRAPTVVTTGAVPLTFARDRAASQPLIYDLTWPGDVASGAYDGAHDIVVTLTDLAGNVATTTLVFLDTDGVAGADRGFVVDATVPTPPLVDTTDAVVFERAPWGRSDRAETDVYRVIGAVGSVEPGAHVLIARDAAARLELGRVVADEDGAFVGDALPLSDTETIHLRAADAAGNVSDAVAVRDVRWFATPLGKVVGSSLENPHAFHELPMLKALLAQGGASERSGVDVGSNDDHRLSTIGAGTWHRANASATSLSSNDVTGNGVASSTIVSDPVHGTTLLFGRMKSVPAGVPGGSVPNGRCGLVQEDLRERDVAGRWRTSLSRPPEGLDFNALAAVFVPPLGKIVVATASLSTFTFDGTIWAETCTSDCVELNDGEVFDESAVSLAWDASRRRLVAVLSDGRLAERSLAGRWQLHALTLSSNTVALYDARAEQLVLATGPLLQRWDGATLTALCQGACADTVPARDGAIVAFDEVNDAYVLFGGLGEIACNINVPAGVIATREQPPQARQPHATDAPTETWTFQDDRWTRHDVAGPPGRTRHAMRWDSLRKRVLLVGGDDCECLGPALSGVSPSMQSGFSNDTWEWDGAAWLQVLDPRSPTTDSFAFSAGAPPAVRDHIVVEGAFLGGPMVHVGDEVHVFRDDAWWKFTSGPGNHGARMAAIASSPTGETFAVAGAKTDTTVFAATSRVVDRLTTGATFVRACAIDETSCEIPERVFGAAAWHDGEHFYVHGGAAFDVNDVNDEDDDFFAVEELARVPADVSVDRLQSFSPSEGWITRCTDGSCGATPTKRFLHRAVLDGDGSVVVFGGLIDGQTTTAETWRFDGSTWSELTDAALPPARAGHVLAWDAARDAVVAAYGTDLGGQPFEVVTSLGILPLVPHEIPVSLSEVWELTGDTWAPAPHVDVEGDGRPSPRSSVAGAGLVEGRVLLLGGSPSPSQTYAEAANMLTTTPVSDEAWVWDGGADTGPAHRFAVRADQVVSLRQPTDELRALRITWRSAAARTNDATTSRALQLLWWDGDSWNIVSDDERVDCGVGCVSAVLDDNKARRAVDATADGSLVVAVTTADPNGPAPGRAVLVTDAVEVQVSWRRPAAAP